MRMSKIIGKRGKQARTQLPVYVKSVDTCDTCDTCGHWSKFTCFFPNMSVYKGAASHDSSSLNAHSLDEMQKRYFSDLL